MLSIFGMSLNKALELFILHVCYVSKNIYAHL